MNRARLGINVDHVATVRQARRGVLPDPVQAALDSIAGGGDVIVCHLREDRRHINDDDLVRMRRKIKSRLNLEMGLAPDIIRAALANKPDQVTLVPEKREELTTEGGLDVRGQLDRIREAVRQFESAGIEVSLFIDPDLRQISASRRTGATIVELHTGTYANAPNKKWELKKIVAAARTARRGGLVVAAGHGLDYTNVKAIARIPEIEELNIGHSIVAQSISEGMRAAVKRMKKVIDAARRRK